LITPVAALLPALRVDFDIGRSVALAKAVSPIELTACTVLLP